MLLESSAIGIQVSKAIAGPGYLDFKFNETKKAETEVARFV